MTAVTPTLAQVIGAVRTTIETAFPTHAVIGFEYTVDEELEYVERVQDFDTGQVDLWVIDYEGADPVAGEAQRETYEPYRIRIRYVTVRKGELDWSGTARDNAETVRTALTHSVAVFRIGNQVPVNGTPETVSAEHGRRELSGGGFVFESVLRLIVEGRRWG